MRRRARLSNLVNFRMDARLLALAKSRAAAYSRYADDITISGPALAPQRGRRNPKTLLKLDLPPDRINDVIHAVKAIVEDEGYVLHTQKKLRIMRRGDRQIVTGLVVNAKLNLPRATRRRLRAADHHMRTGRPASLTPPQLAGWQSLVSMVRAQASARAVK